MRRQDMKLKDPTKERIICKHCNVHMKNLFDSFEYTFADHFDVQCPKCKNKLTICKPCKVPMRFITDGSQFEDAKDYKYSEDEDLKNFRYEGLRTCFQCPKCKSVGGNDSFHCPCEIPLSEIPNPYEHYRHYHGLDIEAWKGLNLTCRESKRDGDA